MTPACQELEVLTVDSARWEEFSTRLDGPEGCNFHKDEKGEIRWKCKAGTNQSLARAILEKMGGIDVDATLAYCTEHGGHCDCEILFNVDR